MRVLPIPCAENLIVQDPDGKMYNLYKIDKLYKLYILG